MEINAKTHHNTPSKALRSCQKGGVMVEAATTFPLFFFVLFVFMEIILSTYNWAIIQFSMDSIARDSIVQTARSTEEIEQRIIARMNRLGLGVTLRPEDILICGASTVDTHCSQGAESRGRAGGFFLVRITHRLNLAFSPWSSTVQSTLFIRNEPR